MSVAISGAVTGIREFDAIISELSKGGMNRVMRPAIRAACKFAAKQVKAKIPGRYKTVRKAINYRMLPTKLNNGFVSGKVGAGVGKKSKAKLKPRKAGRKGVGISSANVHWWFLGTDQRTTGTKRASRRKGSNGTRVPTGGKIRNTGRMPPQSQPVAQIVAANSGAIRHIMTTQMATGLAKEAAALSRKHALAQMRAAQASK
jgi:hypothetical protein